MLLHKFVVIKKRKKKKKKTAFGIFIWFAWSGMVYKSWCLNALELSFILNLGMLAVATVYVKLSAGSQAVVAYTSVGIAFLSFLGIITFHIYMQIKSKVQYKVRGHQLYSIKMKSAKEAVRITAMQVI